MCSSVHSFHAARRFNLMLWPSHPRSVNAARISAIASVTSYLNKLQIHMRTYCNSMRNRYPGNATLNSPQWQHSKRYTPSVHSHTNALSKEYFSSPTAKVGYKTLLYGSSNAQHRHLPEQPCRTWSTGSPFLADQAKPDGDTSLISFGTWSTAAPLAAPPVGAHRSVMRELRKGVTKKLEENGGLAGVQLLTVKPRTPTATRSGEGTHASPVTHPRRGHFRRVPVGPRNDNQHEVRWIPPVIVNPGAQGTGRIHIYRLPRP